jgi:hypothetical protein
MYIAPLNAVDALNQAMRMDLNPTYQWVAYILAL